MVRGFGKSSMMRAYTSGVNAHLSVKPMHIVTWRMRATWCARSFAFIKSNSGGQAGDRLPFQTRSYTTSECPVCPAYEQPVLFRSCNILYPLGF